MVNKKYYLIVILFFTLIFLSTYIDVFDPTEEDKNFLYTIEAKINDSTLTFNEFKDITQDVIFFTNNKWRHVDGEITGNEEINIKIPTENSTLNILWPVKDFGKTVLRLELDNYENNSKVEINKAIAKQKLNTLKNELTHFSENPESIETMKNKADNHFEDEKFQKSLNNSLYGLEKITMTKAEDRINNERKDEHKVKVVNDDGQALENVNVSYELLSNNLDKGWIGDIRNKTVLDKLRSIGFDTYNRFIFWHDLRPKENEWKLDAVNNDIKFYDNKSFDISLSGVISDTPPYTQNISDEKIEQNVSKHVSTIIENVSSFDVGSWECYGFGMHYMADQTLHLTESRDKKKNMNATLSCVETVNNETNTTPIITGWNIDSSEIRYSDYSESPYSYFERISDEEFEIGFDFMYFGGAHEIYPDLEGDVYREEAIGDDNWIPSRHLFSISEMLEWYSELGKPINVQYFQAPSNYVEDQKGYWRSKWDEEVQAKWISKYYKLMYSKPYVNSINYLEPIDNEWKQLETGLFDTNQTTKKSYQMLYKLFNDDLNTYGTKSTNVEGIIQFEGHKGRYKYSISGPNIEDKVIETTDTYTEIVV